MSRSIGFFLAVALTTSLTGCRQDMHDQPKMFPQRGSAFFADGRSARAQLAGTVARGQEATQSYFLTGMADGKEGDGLPFPVTLQILERGQERFNIYCSPCHSRVGDGEGRIVQRGYHQAANFHTLRLEEAPAGHFFNVITHGLGAMPDYHAELAPSDRWAIVAYIRALQLSQDAKPADAAPGMRVVSLTQIADEKGLPTSYADASWRSSTSALPPRPSPPVMIGMSPATSAAPAPVQIAAANPAPSPSAARPSAGQAGAPAGEKSAPAAKPAAAPEAAGGDAAAGKQIYMANCLMCHQATRQGLPPMIPSLVDIVSKVGVDKIKTTVTNGVSTANPPMPAFGSKLSATDIANVIAFLKTKP